MTIEQLDKSKVLISLCKEDMDSFDLNLGNMSFCDEHSRKVLLRLLQLACSKTGIELRKGAVLLEALPHNCGCLLLVTVMEKSKRKRYKVKKYREFPVFVFDNAETLLTCAEAVGDNTVGILRNSLWLYEGRYCLVFDYPVLQPSLWRVLSEYGHRIKATAVTISRIRECGQLIRGGNAMEYIYKSMMCR